MKVDIHDFRVVDRILAETEPDAGDVVFLGVRGRVAYPFVVSRRLSGPGGVYVDAVDIVDADGRSLGVWERTFELDGESKPRDLVNELRGVQFPEPGTYVAQYSVYDDVLATFPFRVVQTDAPATGIVPGPLDAALQKSTIVWVSLDPSPILTAAESGQPTKLPRYLARTEVPVWYGYKDGLVFVLIGEGEQNVPGLTTATVVRLIARSKDVQSLVSDVECSVAILPKDDPSWDAIARDELLGRRLNLRDGDAAVARWKKDCEIVVLTPLPPSLPAEAAETAL